MRGEDSSMPRWTTSCGGSPPHARGRPVAYGDGDEDGGDHPRMRGEDGSDCVCPQLRRGSPPHARGRPEQGGEAILLRRITPACAGKTPSFPIRLVSAGDHPRMRGEDGSSGSSSIRPRGSPPHARGRHDVCGGAESFEMDHPRMRGEDCLSPAVGGLVSGSPPHARGRLASMTGVPVELRITPACAGKTAQGARGSS